jgi:hypothetical protein
VSDSGDNSLAVVLISQDALTVLRWLNCIVHAAPGGAVLYSRFFNFIHMARIPDSLLSSVVVLYRSREAADSSAGAVGLGFIVDGLSPRGNTPLSYLIASGNVASSGSAATVAVPARNGESTSLYEIDPSQWVMHPQGEDVAAVCLNFLPAAEHRTADALIEADFVTPERIRVGDVAIGDEVIAVDRTIIRSNDQFGEPVVRFGRISAMPQSPAGERRNEDSILFGVEMRTRAGLSGSPVFVYGRDVAGSVRRGIDRSWALLGISGGYIFDSAGENTWLNGIIPAWKITEVLDAPAMWNKRMESGSRHRCCCHLCAESAGLFGEEGTAVRDAILRNMLQTPPFSRRKRVE